MGEKIGFSIKSINFYFIKQRIGSLHVTHYFNTVKLQIKYSNIVYNDFMSSVAERVCSQAGKGIVLSSSLGCA